jgi:protein-tyrosine kinase
MHATDTDAANGASAGQLRSLHTNGASATAPDREWLFPGSDELFRKIYTGSGTGSSEALAVCSAIVGEGKSTVALGLSATIAQDFPDQRVLLVETDLQRPTLAEDFGIEPSPGLVDCLLEDRPVQTAYHTTFLENFHVVPVGVPTAKSGRLLRSGRMAAALAAMRQSHGIVILDVPAVLANSDSVLVADLVDGVIFVVRAGVTPAHLTARAIEQIDERKLRGVVLNEVQSAVPGWLRRVFGL